MKPFLVWVVVAALGLLWEIYGDFAWWIDIPVNVGVGLAAVAVLRFDENQRGKRFEMNIVIGCAVFGLVGIAHGLVT